MGDKLVRLRFLFGVTHLAILCVVYFWKREDIAKHVLLVYLLNYSDDLRMNNLDLALEKKIEMLTMILITGISLICIELSLFIGGLSMFKNWQCLNSTLCHFIGACASSYLLFTGWNELHFAITFFISIVIPSLAEGFILIDHLLKKV
ncbi:uncharacterized protein LOC129231522 [Uloborus diversus]|uniref:uncharacterized protein LOC129231522 n=1 Tax=Uloborus diversus TaxID=327109 RepID=UPI00240A3934|nr:uncharacterized protein LOC129231522 [Uloborus diversus]